MVFLYAQTKTVNSCITNIRVHSILIRFYWVSEQFARHKEWANFCASVGRSRAITFNFTGLRTLTSNYRLYPWIPTGAPQNPIL